MRDLAGVEYFVDEGKPKAIVFVGATARDAADTYRDLQDKILSASRARYRGSYRTDAGMFCEAIVVALLGKLEDQRLEETPANYWDAID